MRERWGGAMKPGLRGLCLAFAFAILVIGGFLLSPSVLASVNFAYQMYNKQTATQRQELDKQKATLSANIDATNEHIMQETAAATLASNPADAAKLAADAATLSGHATLAKSDLKAVQAQIDQIDQRRDALYADSENLFLVIRALCLGALGTFVLVLTKFVSDPRRGPLFDQVGFERVLASMVVGAMVSVVAFGLFYTKQISLFSHAETPTPTPDFWRTTILCLVAGTFADRIFDAASKRLNIYLSTDVLAPNRKKAASRASKRKPADAQPSEVPELVGGRSRDAA